MAINFAGAAAITGATIPLWFLATNWLLVAVTTPGAATIGAVYASEAITPGLAATQAMTAKMAMA